MCIRQRMADLYDRGWADLAVGNAAGGVANGHLSCLGHRRDGRKPPSGAADGARSTQDKHARVSHDHAIYTKIAGR